MKNAILVMVHLLARLAVLLGTGGTRAILAENFLLKQQLLVLQRSRRRAPNLRTTDRWLFGFCAQFMSLRRLIRTAIILKPTIRQTHDNGATGITFFTAGSLKDKHLAILKKYNEAYNK